MPNLRSTNTILAICFAIWVVIVARTMMNTKGPEDFVFSVPQSEIQAYSKDQLAAVQRRSFAESQEICGVVFEYSSGELGTTPLMEGEKASCDIGYFDEPGMAPVASFHTHGDFDREYDSEVPSLQDMQSDIQNGTDGYVATPGGRFWRIDSQAEIAIQICGEGCLPKDPDYQACKGDEPRQRYSVVELEARFKDDTGRC